MVDPFGIVGVIGVAVQITKTLVDLGLDWKDAPSDVVSFLQELNTLKTILSVSRSNLELDQDFIDAFEGRQSAVLSQLGKDAPLTDSNLMVEACYHELDQLLAELKERSRGHRGGWNRIKSTFLAKKTRETVEKLQRQCQMLNSLVAIDTAALGAMTLTEVRDGRKDQKDREAAARRDKILEWVTPISYATQQNDYAGRRRPGTGEWLLHSKEYCAWRDADEKPQALFCPGIPGAGKTIIASMIIEDLYAEFAGDGSVGVAYVYCNFREHANQKAENLLLSLLKQLAQGQPSLPHILGDLYEKHKERRTRPSMTEVCSTLESVAGLYGRVFIVIDALDESPFEERDTVLGAITGVQAEAQVSVLATSRPEILTHFSEHFEMHKTKEIRAVDGDILDYVNDLLERVRRPRLTKHDDLKARIGQKVVEEANGMFLLAKLQMGYLLSKSTIGDIREALENLRRGQEGLNFLYEEAMQRINNQPDGPKELTTNVLRWIVHAKRPLKTVELRCALAIRLGTRELDHDYMPEVDDMVSDSAGLVTIDEESGIIRLVHFTTQDYFERTREKWFRDAETRMAEACATFLSFDIWVNAKARNKLRFRQDDYQGFRPPHWLCLFYKYAEDHLGDHTRESASSAPIPSVDGFLQDEAKVSIVGQLILSGYFNNYQVDMDTNPKRVDPTAGWTGLHWVAYVGDERYLDPLCRGTNLDCEVLGGTPLAWAADRGHISILENLLARGASPEHGAGDGGTPLYWAARGGQVGVVELLLNRGVDINSVNLRGSTSLAAAVQWGHEDIVALLIDRGADVRIPTKKGRLPLSVAAGNGDARIVGLLLAADAVDVDTRDEHGGTPLIYALEGRHTLVAKVLLNESGADPCLASSNGTTPLMIAAKKGLVEIVQLLLAMDVEVDAVNEDDQTALGRACYKQASVVRMLLTEAAANPNLGTPLHLALFYRDVEIVELLLGDCRVDVNLKDKAGQSPLHVAIGPPLNLLGGSGAPYEVISLLLARNDLDPSLESMDDYNNLYAGRECASLVTAAKYDYRQLLEVLTGCPRVAVNERDCNGYTPLSWAAWRGDEHTATALLTRGDIDLHHRTNAGETPLDLAVRNGHREVLRMLLAAHEKIGARADGRFELMLRAWDDEAEEEPVCVGIHEHGDEIYSFLMPWRRSGSLEEMERFLLDAYLGDEPFEKLLRERNYEIEIHMEYGPTPGIEWRKVEWENVVLHPFEWREAVKPASTVWVEMDLNRSGSDDEFLSLVVPHSVKE